jgi:hypothetical protein
VSHDAGADNDPDFASERHGLTLALTPITQRSITSAF